jgi:Zn-dependent protease with chaperone function
MDFFEAQALAKKRTRLLVVLFALAVVGTIAAAYVAAVFGKAALDSRGHSRGAYYADAYTEEHITLFQPQLLAGVTLGTLAIVGIASLIKWAQFSSGGAAVAESVGGRLVSPHTTDLNERRLLNVVEEMAIASGTPVPPVYVLDDEPALNAFAAGLTSSDAVIAVTEGTLQKLTRDELQGVIGHEFSHILNGDMRLNVRLTSLLFGILVLGLAGRGILWSLRGARFSSRDNKNSGGVVAFIVVAGVSLLIVGYVGYFFGRLIQAAVSRQREFLADASSVQFTRNPAGLSGALKKIGGYALGSSLQTSKAAAIGHFFFAQSFRSGFTGLWATHPPLEERIRAIEPQFDGTMFQPQEVVDVTQESFVSAHLSPPAPQVTAPFAPPLRPFDPVTAIESIGTLTAAQVSNAESLLASLPASIREATRSRDNAPLLLYGLLLSENGAVRERQVARVSQTAPTGVASLLDFYTELNALAPEQRLPVAQLTLPALRALPPETIREFLKTLGELVHADNHVSVFEFALQKLVTHTLIVGDAPRAAMTQYYSFNALIEEIGVVLSVLAQTSSGEHAANAFSAGAAQLKLIERELQFTATASDFEAFDRSLDKLAVASGPIKQRTLLACAYVVSADGSVSVEEGELLRAVAATLDCPMPPLL